MGNKEIAEFCPISPQSESLLKETAKNNYSSMRGFNKCLKIARTIADIEYRENISESDIAEAIQYRFLDSFFDIAN